MKIKNFSILSFISLAICSCTSFDGGYKPCVSHCNHYDDYSQALAKLKTATPKGFSTSFFLNFEEFEECKNSSFYCSLDGICCDRERPADDQNYRCQDFGVFWSKIYITNDNFCVAMGLSCKHVVGEYAITGTISMSDYLNHGKETIERGLKFSTFKNAKEGSAEAAFGYKTIEDYDVFVTKSFDLVSDQDQHVFGSVTYSKDCPTDTITSINNKILYNLNNRK